MSNNRLRRANGLGRGLDALIPAAPAETPPADTPIIPAAPQSLGTGLMLLPMSSIRPNPYQPRDYFDEEKLHELSDSIREHGLLQPLVVARIPDADLATMADDAPHPVYQLIAGERRFKAAQIVGLTSVPAVVKDANTQQMLELALIENIQRADLNPLEEARAYKQLVDEFGLTQDAVAKRVGKSRVAVTNALRLLALPDLILDYVKTGQMSEGHARAVLQVKGLRGQLRLAEQIVLNKLNVRQAEDLANKINADADFHTGNENSPARRDSDLQQLAGQLQSRLMAKVEITRSGKGGKIVISFTDDDEFQGIFERLTGETE